MELLAYIFVLILTLLVSFSRGTITAYSSIFVFALLMSYMVVVRYSGFDVDVKTYAEHFDYDLDIFLSNFYYYKEPFFWFGSAWIQQNITHSAELTYLVFDGLCLVLLLRACKHYEQPAFFVFLFYTSFPSVMEYNNAYRQFIVACFIVYILSLLWSGGGFKRYLYAFFALLSHHLSVVFFPLIVFLRKKTLMWMSLCIILGLSGFVIQYKSQGFQTGLQLKWLYALLIFTWATLLVKDERIKYYGLFFALSYFGLLFVFQDENVERFGMVYIQVMLAFVCILISRKYRPVALARFILLLMMTVPVFLFSSAYQFLQ